MSMSFTKLFSSITESTVWMEPDAVRLTWITMLAMADRRGRVWASVPGLAHKARVETEDCRAALQKFLSPDPDSRTPDNEGRRIEVIDGGWRLLNHAKYREIRDQEAAKEAKREYINTRRAKERVEKLSTVEHGRTQSNAVEQSKPSVNGCRDNAEADAAPESEAESREQIQKAEPVPKLPVSPATRRRDLVFEALAVVEGVDPSKPIADHIRGKVNMARKQILDVDPDATGEEVARRFENYKATMPRATKTALGLAGNWHRLTEQKTIESLKAANGVTQKPDWRAEKAARECPENIPMPKIL